jgi:peptidyl-prolyl cis-trans isomerase SurA
MKLRIVLFLLLPFLTIAQPPEGKVVDMVLAMVGGNYILLSDVENQYQQYLLSSGKESDEVKCAIFEDLLFEKLLIHQAEIDSIEVSEEEVDNMMDRRIDMLVRQIGSKKRLEEFYGKTVIEIKEEMRPLVRNQLIAQRMQGKIVQGISITPGEVREYFNAINPDSLPYVNSQVEVAQIVKLPDISEEAKEEAKQKLLDIKGRIASGSKFSTMAILYSEDPGSARNGGEYKGVKRGQFVKEFEAVAFALREGEVSDPFETEYGWHIVELIAKRGQEIDVRHILIVPQIREKDLIEAKRFVDSLRVMIEDGFISFHEAAEKYSDDDLTKNNGGVLVNPMSGDSKFEIAELDRSVYFTIEDVNVGEVSRSYLYKTADNKDAYRIILLMSRSDPHRANLQDDYTKIKDAALVAKQQKVLDEWTADTIDDTFVMVKNVMNCDFRTNWTKTKK